MTKKEYEKTTIYQRGKNFENLGKVLMNQKSTLVQIAKAANKCDLTFQFGLFPEKVESSKEKLND